MADVDRIRIVDLEHTGGFEFRVSFSPEMAQLVMDEGPPLGKGAGPEAARVLAAAVGNCLSASLLLCLQKSHVDVRSMKTHVEAIVDRNDRGRFRISSTSVEIRLDLGEGDAARVERCFGLFEDYCIVTASVRQGIPVTVSVVDPNGKELHRG